MGSTGGSSGLVKATGFGRLRLRVRVYSRVYIGIIYGLYRDNGKENGNYYLGFRV